MLKSLSTFSFLFLFKRTLSFTPFRWRRHWPQARNAARRNLKSTQLIFRKGEKRNPKCSTPLPLVADLKHHDADPDPYFHFDTDPDPNFHFDADPYPVPHQSDPDLRQLVYRSSTAPYFELSTRPPSWTCTGPESWLWYGSGFIFEPASDSDPIPKMIQQCPPPPHHGYLCTNNRSGTLFPFRHSTHCYFLESRPTLSPCSEPVIPLYVS